LFPAYEYRLSPPADPTGPSCVEPPVPASCHRLVGAGQAGGSRPWRPSSWPKLAAFARPSYPARPTAARSSARARAASLAPLLLGCCRVNQWQSAAVATCRARGARPPPGCDVCRRKLRQTSSLETSAPGRRICPAAAPARGRAATSLDRGIAGCRRPPARRERARPRPPLPVARVRATLHPPFPAVNRAPGLRYPRRGPALHSGATAPLPAFTCGFRDAPPCPMPRICRNFRSSRAPRDRRGAAHDSAMGSP
jgi:hypothetical protein